jgi:hypothetical protein
MALRFYLATAACVLTLALPATATPKEVTTFADNLAAQMGAHLESTLQRRPISLTLTPVDISRPEEGKCDRCGTFRLNVPSHIERDTVLDLHIRFEQKTPAIEGRVYSEAQRNLITQVAEGVFPDGVRVSLNHFPYSDVQLDYGITITPSSSLYVKPVAEAGENLATQVRLGTPVRILEYSPDKAFARVQIADDGYIAWIQRNQLREVDAPAFDQWLNNRQVLLTETVQSPRLLYFGTRLKLVKQDPKKITAALPDGKPVVLDSSDVALVSPQKLDVNKLLKVAHQFLPQGPQGKGTYLWGGSLGNRVDCSGFVQTVFRSQHIYLPRDADQQKGFSRLVGATLKEIDELRAGDLVFFSGNRKYPTHVGIYIGGYKYIHSSPKGPYSGVKISTLRGGDAYDQSLQKIYFGGGRVENSLL